MKILHLAYDAGGIHTRLYQDIIAAYRTAGHEVIEAYLVGSIPENYDTPANRVVALDFSRRGLKGLRRLFVCGQLRRFLLREQFNVIITHRRKPAELAAHASRGLVMYKRLAVWHDEGEFDRWSTCWGARRLFRDFLLIGVSDAVRDDLLLSRAHFAPSQVAAINNAIDVATLEPRLLARSEARKQMQLSTSDFVFGTVGRLVPKKGHADLIRAFAAMPIRAPNTHLVIIGTGRCDADLRTQIEALGVTDSVHLMGAIPEAFRYLQAFDVFVLPSYREGLPIALLEAACARLPIIASDIGGNRTVLDDVGVLVPVGNIDKLQEAMTICVGQPGAEHHRVGETLYGRLRQYFDRPVMLEAYQRLLAK
jgi:glycosyltransferase involved in cell wall biosynthesis